MINTPLLIEFLLLGLFLAVAFWPCQRKPKARRYPWLTRRVKR